LYPPATMSVARVKRLAAEPAFSEGVAEAVDRLGPHRLGAVEGERPPAEIQGALLLFSHFLRAQIVGEVRAAADRRAGLRNGLQPTHGLLEEMRRRQQRVRPAHIQRLQNAADQAHVVIQGQPEASAA
jgi:hypothetical protein